MPADPAFSTRPAADGGTSKAGWATRDFASEAERFFAWFEALQHTEPGFVWAGIFSLSSAPEPVLAHLPQRDDLATGLLPLVRNAHEQAQLKLAAIQGPNAGMAGIAAPLLNGRYVCAAALDKKLVEASRLTPLFELAVDRLASSLESSREAPSLGPETLSPEAILDLALARDDEDFPQKLFSTLANGFKPHLSLLARVEAGHIDVLRTSQTGDPLPAGSRAGNARRAAFLTAAQADGPVLLSGDQGEAETALDHFVKEETLARALAVTLPGGRRSRLVWLAAWDSAPRDLDEKHAALAPGLSQLSRLLRSGNESARPLTGAGLTTWLDPRGWRLWLALAAVALAVWLLLPAPFHVIGEARLQSAEQRALVAPRDGFLSAVHVRPGDTVEKGQILAEFDTRELVLRRARIEAQLDQATSRRMNAMAEFKTAQVQVSNAEIAAMSAERDLVALLLDQSRLVAEEDGVVISGDMAERVGTAMRHGEPMFQLAPSGRYQLLIDIPQKDVTETAIGQTGALRLTALPFDTFPITLERLSLSTERPDGSAGFVGIARIENGSDAFRPGMQGVAQIEAGQSVRAWVLLRDFIFWAEMQWWRWVP